MNDILLYCFAQSNTRKQCQTKLCKLQATQRSNLAHWLRMGRGWPEVDQSNPANVRLFIAELIAAAYNPLERFRIELDLDSHVHSFTKLTRKYPWTAATTMDACVHSIGTSSGSGVCLTADGLLLTAAHVVDHEDDPEEGSSKPPPNRVGRRVFWIFPSGRTVVAVCIAADEAADTAFLRVEASSEEGPFPFATLLSHGDAKQHSRIMCIGNPFEFDLECPDDSKTAFSPAIFHTSLGSLLGYHRNRAKCTSDGMGPLIHDAWTYWGHSGAPLFSCKDGTVIGIHNSWDESNSDRRGIPVSLILAVAKKHKIKLVPVDDITSEDEDDSDVDMLDISVIDLT